jgi:hypothetical protein
MTVGAAKFGLFAAAGAGGNDDGAYWLGGVNTDTIVQTRFDTDATATLSATLTEQMKDNGTFGNGVTAAYTGGNNWGTPNWGRDYIGKFTFADQSYALIVATLSEITWGDAGAANSGTAGYFAGGQGRSGGSSVQLDNIDKLLFADDSCSLIGPTLSAVTYYPAGAANSGTAAYWFGGYAGGRTNKIDKTDFSDDSTADSGSDLSDAGMYQCASANSGTAAYCQLAYLASSYSKKINKLLFSDDSVSDLGEELTTATSGMSSAAQKGTFAYFAGGLEWGGNRLDVMEKLTFTSDTSAVLGATLPAASAYFGGASCDMGMV